MASLRSAVKLMLRVDRVKQKLAQLVTVQVQTEGSALSKEIARQVQTDCQTVSEAVMQRVRAEYTVLPRFQFHQPLDYDANTYPVAFEPPVWISGEELPVPPPADRMGYCPNDPVEYLAWGKYDHDYIMGHIRNHAHGLQNCTVLDFGCSSGRVLRHFDAERRDRGWRLWGVDIQARPIERMRYHFTDHIQVSGCSTMPHQPF